MDLAQKVYETTNRFPVEERYGLVSQMRRASVSVPSNIAEGFGRESGGSFAMFLRNAQGSLKELETQLMLSRRLRMLDERSADELLDDCEVAGKMLGGLIRSVVAGANNEPRMTTDSTPKAAS